MIPECKLVIGTVKNHLISILIHNKKMSAADDPVSRLWIIRGTGNHTETLTGVGNLADVEGF